MNGEKADMVFTDPPYWIWLDKEWQTIWKSQKYWAVLNDWDNTVAIDVFNLVSWLWIEILFFWWANHYSNILPSSPCWIVWDKQWWKHVTYADVELCYSNIDAPARMFTHIWDWFRKDSEKWEKRIHPTQKPISLYDFCFQFAKLEAGAKVLDTHLGSGSSRISANKNGLNFVGFEIDEEYYNKQNKRYDDFVSQVRLF